MSSRPRATCVVFGALWLASCGAGGKRISKIIGSPRAPERAVEADADIHGEREAESPAAAAEFYLLRRSGGVSLPVEKLLAARRQKDSMPAHPIGSDQPERRRSESSARDVSVGNWQLAGPANVGGRTRALVIRPDDPNTMYAGSVSGGVWKTTDGGNTWTPLTDLLPSLAIATLAMDPKNPDTIYAGTGEWFAGGSSIGNSIRGAGIYKTTDGGATWTQLPGPGSNYFDYVNKIVVSPNNSQNVYAATWGGIFRSSDGGNTWHLQLKRTGSQYGCQDLVIRTDQPADYLFAACAYLAGTDPAIYRNVDAAGAGAWEVVFTTNNMARTTLALAPSNQSMIYAAVTSSEEGDYHDGLLGIWLSMSSGDPGSWMQQVSNRDANPLNTVLFSHPTDLFADVCSGGTRSFDNHGQYDNAIAVDPVNSNVVWVGGIDLFRSDDGGRNWGIASFWEVSPPQGSHADNHVIVFSPNYDGAGNQTLFATSDGGIYRTDNALAATAIGGRAACAPFSNEVAWTNLNNGYAVTQFYNGAVFPGGAAYLGGTQDNGTELGADAAGQNWMRVLYGDGGWTAVDPTDPNIWYAEGTRFSALELHKTSNGGGTWALATKGINEPGPNFLFITPFVMDPSQHLRLYVGGRTLWRTNDGAASWTAVSAAIPTSAGSISAIAVSPSDPSTVMFGTSSGFVFRSGDALRASSTTAWPSAQPRSGYLSSLAFDPANPAVVYATYSQYKQSASQSHIYRSKDGGVTWTGIDGTGSTGLPDIPVFTLIVDPQNTASLYIGTDIGLFVSTDGGATWARDANPFADAVTETLVLDRSAGQSNLVAFTHGRGVWKTALPGSAASCHYALSGNAAGFPAYGGSASFQVTVSKGCAWSVVAVSPMDLEDHPQSTGLTISSPAGGSGNGSFSITAPMNNTAQPRNTTVSVQGSAIAVTQDAAAVATANPVSSPFPFGALPAVVIEDTSGNTESPDDPVHSCTGSKDFKTAWFSLVAQAAGTMSLRFSDRRVDAAADAGMVLTLYRNGNGAPGAEIYCRVIPQTAGGGYHWVTMTRSVQPGDSFLLEVSATVSGAPAGASVMGGHLTLAAFVN